MEPVMDRNAVATVPPQTGVAALLEHLAACSRDEKRFLLERILRDLLGDEPQGEYSILNEDGSAYIHLLSPVARATLYAAPRVAQWEAEAREGRQVLHSDIVARMQAGTFGRADEC